MQLQEAMPAIQAGKKLKSENGLIIDKNSKYTVGFLLQFEWEIVEREIIFFQEALDAFKKGKSIRRKSWNDKGIKFYLNNFIPIKTYECKGLYGAATYDRDQNFFSVEDALADDWEIVE